MRRTIFAIALGILATASKLNATDRPNILWLSVEDISPHLGCYADDHARTPNLDAFAAQGVLYENAFVCAPVCAPCRSSIITGVYPTTLGTHNMRSRIQLPPKIKCFPEYLQAAGYYCTNNSKTDYQFSPPKSAWDESSRWAHWRNRPDKGQPFFAVFNYTGTHESAVRGDGNYRQTEKRLPADQRHDPALLELPPYYPDTPAVREDWARYYNTITAMDLWFAEQLAELDATGLSDDTIVFFWSDHGVGLPRGKRWLYDSGIHVPLIVRIPEKFRTTGQGRPGQRTDELVSLIDLPPTVLKLAGLGIPNHMQGRAFLGDELQPERQYIFAARDRMDERYDIIRTVRDKRYKYIRNFEPWKPYAQWLSYAERNAVMKELRRLHAKGRLAPAAARFMNSEKPLEELFDLKEDPHELNNLATSDDHSATLSQLRKALTQWQANTGDLGWVVESDLPGLSDGKTRWDIALQFQQGGGGEHGIYSFWADTLKTAAPDSQEVQDALARAVVRTPPNSWRRWETPVVIAWLARLCSADDDARAKTVEMLDLLAQATPHRQAANRVAAAEWLCRLGKTEQGLPVLVEELENDNRWIRLRAANAIDLLGEDARPVIPALRKAKERSIAAAKGNKLDKYVARVTNHTLNTLLGTDEKVR